MQQEHNINNILISFTDSSSNINATKSIEINQNNFYISNQIRKYIKKIGEIVQSQPGFDNTSRNFCISYKDNGDQIKTEVTIVPATNSNLATTNPTTNSSKIHLSIKTLSGKIIPIEIHRHDTVSGLKKLIKQKEGIKISQQILLHNNEKLRNKRILSSCAINSGNTLCLVLRVTKEKRNKQSDEVEEKHSDEVKKNKKVKYFKLVVGHDENTGERITRGRFSGKTPRNAAAKAFCSIMREQKAMNEDLINKPVEFEILTTHKDNTRVYAFKGTRSKPEIPFTIPIRDKEDPNKISKTLEGKYINVIKRKSNDNDKTEDNDGTGEDTDDFEEDTETEDSDDFEEDTETEKDIVDPKEDAELNKKREDIQSC